MVENLNTCGCGKRPFVNAWQEDLGGFDGFERRVQVRCDCGIQTGALYDNPASRARLLTVWNTAFAAGESQTPPAQQKED